MEINPPIPEENHPPTMENQNLNLYSDELFTLYFDADDIDKDNLEIGAYMIGGPSCYESAGFSGGVGGALHADLSEGECIGETFTQGKYRAKDIPHGEYSNIIDLNITVLDGTREENFAPIAKDVYRAVRLEKGSLVFHLPSLNIELDKNGQQSGTYYSLFYPNVEILPCDNEIPSPPSPRPHKPTEELMYLPDDGPRRSGYISLLDQIVNFFKNIF